MNLRRSELLQLLGDMPEERGEVQADLIRQEDRGSYFIEKLLLDLNGLEKAPAYFIRPKQAPGPYPVVLFNHSHGGNYHIGKEELISGTTYLQTPNYAEFLTGLGFAVLCFDTWAFGERAVRSEGDIFKQMLWEGKVMWGMMVYDSMRAIDYLNGRTDVDLDRLVTLGISMGGTMAWWLAALDERVKYCVDICSLADYQSLIATKALHRHGLYYYVPRLLKHFTTGQINALIAPRSHLSLVGLQDDLVPAIGLDRVEQEARQAYARLGAEEAWRLLRYDAGHQETPEMRKEIEGFLRQI